MKRKLTTILFADAQGYSTMMASDEAATLERLNRYRAIMQGLFERHDGRQINTWGDAVIAEFASVVEAVRCAVEIQDSLSTENNSLPKAKQMWFRIGINLGDVMIDRDDLYGDGVNVAQRLQALAEPGGVMVSGTVYSLVHKQLAVAFDFAGDQKVTEGPDRVPSYKVRMSGRNTPEAAAATGTTADPRPDAEPQPSASAIGKTAALAEGLLGWLKHQPPRVRRAAGAIAVVFVINVLFDGLANPWFLYPSVPLALYIYFHYRRGQDPLRDDRGRLHGRGASRAAERGGESESMTETVKANGAEIPAIGLGTWDLRGDAVAPAVHAALDAGYRHIDTAAMYANETEVGEAIQSHATPRSEIWITTKVWASDLADGRLQKSAEASLKRLKLDQVDLLLIHWPSREVPFREQVLALCDAKRRGLARHIGVANFTPKFLESAVAIATEPIVTNQVEHHPWLDQRKLMATAEKLGVSTTSYSPLGRTRLLAERAIVDIARAKGKTPAQVVLRWHVQQPMNIAIPKSANPQRIAENIAIFDFALTNEEMQRISGLARKDGRMVQGSYPTDWDAAPH